MVLVKTEAGQAALKDRQGGLTPRQRSAFILFDGKRSLADVLGATAAMGITIADVQTMIDQGLLADTKGATPDLREPRAAAATPAASPAPAPVPAAVLASAPQATPKAGPDSVPPGPQLDATRPTTMPGEGSGRSPSERYRDAYPVATQLTASLGLRGFRLNLAVEGATSFDDLAALAPKIREAVGDAKYTRLDQALFA